MTEAVILTPVLGLVCYLVGDLLVHGGEAWWWRKLASLVRHVRSRWRAWRRARYRKRVEASLDKVAELVGRREDCEATDPFGWPEELTRLRFDASAQLIECEVDWVVEFPNYGATVKLERRGMQVDWGDLDIEADPRLRSVGVGGRRGPPPQRD